MPERVWPMGKIACVSDAVVVGESGLPSIQDIRTELVAPGGVFPFTRPVLYVSAWLTGGVGDVRLEADIVDAVSREQVYESLGTVLSFRDRRQVMLAVIRLAGVRFERRGEYVVELFCQGGVFLDDWLLTVS